MPGRKVIELTDLDTKIETDRLELEPLLREHAKELCPVLSDARLYVFTRERPPDSLADLYERYSLLESRRSPDGTQLWLNWVIVRRDPQVAIGYIQASVDLDYADIAWVVGSAWQGRGYATEAARALVLLLRSQGVRRINARVHPKHVASQRVAAKVGLVETDEEVEGETVWVSDSDQR